MERKKIRRLAATAVALAAIGVGTLATAAPASAMDETALNGVVEPGEFGLYYGHAFEHPIYDLFSEDENFGSKHFPHSTLPVNNDTEAYWNDDSYRWYVYTGAYASGSEGWIPPGYTGSASSKFKDTITSAYYYDAN